MRSLTRSGCKGLNVLITSGPTSVAIDGMRVITNRSTGEMGRLIAGALSGAGAHVTLLEGAVTTEEPLPRVRRQRFFLFDELDALLTRELRRKYDVVIHAAAVSDFKPLKTMSGKIASGRNLTLKLSPTKKLVNSIKVLAPRVKLVAFKLEPSASLKQLKIKADGLFKEAGADLVVANSVAGGKYYGVVLDAEGRVSRPAQHKKELVRILTAALGGLFR